MYAFENKNNSSTIFVSLTSLRIFINSSFYSIFLFTLTCRNEFQDFPQIMKSFIRFHLEKPSHWL